MYLQNLNKYKEKYGFRLYAFMLAADQLNLLLELKEATNISMIMHDITSSYTKYFNGRYNRKGHLFRERFKSVIAQKEPYILPLIRYIHHLAVELGLVSTATDYAFSSALFYQSGVAEESAQNLETLKNLLNLEDEAGQVNRIKEEICPEKKDELGFMSAISGEESGQLAEELEREWILGSTDFINSVKSQMQRSRLASQPRSLWGRPAFLISAVIVTAAAVSAIVLGIRYINSKEKELTVRLKEESDKVLAEKKAELEHYLVSLDKSEWVIEIKAEEKLNSPYPAFDKLIFKDGTVYSRYFLSQGFAASYYTLTIRADGTLVWETMQKNAQSDSLFWRGEATKDAKMTGGFSLRPIKGETKDAAFSSSGYQKLQ